MLYQWYELGHAAVRPARFAADAGRLFFRNPFNPLTHTPVGRHAAAACEVFERTTRRYDKPAFRIARTTIDGARVAVREEVAWKRPFCRLVHFVRDIPAERAGRDPRILLVAPMSGHFATLLRGTVETLLPDHEVYITDWVDARDVPVTAGSFDLDDYIVYMGDLFRHFGGDVHVFAVCQPSVPVLAAVALMEEDDDPNVPLSLVLAGGPVDTRVSPTIVNQLAEKRGVDWFRRNVITSVPWPSRGAGRQVYPGFLQLSGFMTMNLDRHVRAHKDLFLHLVRGDGDSAVKHREFYDEYLAVMDLTAEFFLQTIDTVFVRHALPRGLMTHRGRRVNLESIRRVGLLTIEGEKDDITGLGQCAAATALCASIPPEHREHYECPDVGHYGIFNGSRFRAQIAPRISEFVRRHDPRCGRAGALTAIERDAAIARASGGACEFEASAFSFAPANDRAPDPMAHVLRARGLGGGPAAATTPVSRVATMPLGLWSLIGNLFLDSLTRFFAPPSRILPGDARR
jgi:poly(3-hydroxybutyrate) depolymerase